MAAKRRTWKKWALALASLGLAVAAALFALVLYKDRTYYHSPRHTPPPPGRADAVVIYYSRSGHTEAMARAVARELSADVVKLTAAAYSLDFAGWRRAAADARNERLTAIRPARVDVSRYRLVLLGSPIWFFRPAPPLWTFVARSDLEGKRVVLFNTFNSRFKAEQIEAFRRAVARRGGELVDHIYVRRGRVIYQKSGEQLVQEARQLVRARAAAWRR